jgi:hypothetical protein
MTTATAETVDEFAARHGGHPVRVGGRVVFPDGACIDDWSRRVEDATEG